MRTKDLVVGQEYIIGNKARFGYRNRRGILLTKDSTWIRTQRVHSGLLNGRLDISVPANKDVGERGGLAFAIQGWEGVWIPVVVQPGTVLCTAATWDTYEAEREAKEQEEYIRREAERQRRNREAQANRLWRNVRHGWLNVRLQAAGLPTVHFDAWNERSFAQVDVSFVEQVLAKVGVTDK